MVIRLLKPFLISVSAAAFVTEVIVSVMVHTGRSGGNEKKPRRHGVALGQEDKKMKRSHASLRGSLLTAISSVLRLLTQTSSSEEGPR